MADGWRYILVESKELNVLANFKECKGRTLTLDLNKSGTTSGSIHMREQGSELIFPRSTGIIAQFDDEAVWSGYINDRQVDVDSAIVSFSAVGWFNRLMELEIQDLTLDYVDLDGGEIIRRLLLKALDQDPNLVVTIGTVQPTALRTVSYTRGQKIGAAIQDLIELEYGPNWEIDPITRKIDLINPDNVVRRPDCKWVLAYDDETGYPSPQSNLSNCVEGTSDDIVNDIRPIGANTQVVGIVDFASQDEYGVVQESPSLPEVVDVNILQAFGETEIAYRAEPVPIYTMSPKPSYAGNVPRFHKNFKLGDIGFLTLKRYWIDSVDLAQRIFGLTISIADDGKSETISSITTRAS